MRKLYNYEPAMTFAEIAAKLGCSESAAQATFVRAIWKLRRHPDRFRKVIGLIHLRAEIRREAQ